MLQWSYYLPGTGVELESHKARSSLAISPEWRDSLLIPHPPSFILHPPSRHAHHDLAELGVGLDVRLGRWQLIEWEYLVYQGRDMAFCEAGQQVARKTAHRLDAP